MREKIIAQLRKMFPGVNLSAARLNAIADKLAAKITDETEIEVKLNDLNDIMPFADIAKEDDRVRTLEAKVRDIKPADPAKPQDPAPDPAKPDEAAALLKALIQKVDSLQADKVAGGMRATLKAKLKDVPESYYAKRALPEKEEELEAFIEEVNNDYSAFKQDLVTQGLMSSTPPAGGSGGGNAEAGKKDIEAWAASKGEVKK